MDHEFKVPIPKRKLDKINLEDVEVTKLKQTKEVNKQDHSIYDERLNHELISSPSLVEASVMEPTLTIRTFKPPVWAACPPRDPTSQSPSYYIDIIKDGVKIGHEIIGETPFYLFGRAPICDIALLHESISRQHAVMVFNVAGQAFLVDLESTHGTFINHIHDPVSPHTYHRLKDGDELEFGLSKRTYILNLKPPMPKKTVVDMPLEEEEEDPIQREDKLDLDDEESSLVNEEGESHQREVHDLALVTHYLGYNTIDDVEERLEQTESSLTAIIHPSQCETYETVSMKYNALNQAIDQLQDEIEQLQARIEQDGERQRLEVADEIDSLDAYMSSVSQMIDERTYLNKKLALQQEFKHASLMMHSFVRQLKPSIEGTPSLTKHKELRSMAEGFGKMIARHIQQSGTMNKLSWFKSSSSIDTPLGPVQVKRSREALEKLTKEVIDHDQGDDKDKSRQNQSNMKQDQMGTRMNSNWDHDQNKKVDEPRTSKATEIEIDEENNVMWTPPVGQTGDGRTTLNDKFGY